MRWNGKALRQARKNAGMTQDELAANLGVTRQAVSVWENGGEGPMSLATSLRLAEILAVDVSSFLVADVCLTSAVRTGER